MKVMIVALALVAVAAAASVPEKEVVIVRSENVQKPDGGYLFNYENSDGSTRQETGELKTVNDADNKPVEVLVVRGQYAYPDETGKLQAIEYFADESGFHATGDSIPKVASR